ncbi:MAG: hypothetical protein ABI744_00020 [Chloroflexota bacterium]
MVGCRCDELTGRAERLGSVCSPSRHRNEEGLCRSHATAAIALQNPQSRAVLSALTGADWTDLAYYRRRAAHVGKIALDVSRTGYTGDLGYELWVDATQAVELWDRLIEVGTQFGIHAAGMLGLDMTRLEAG